MGKHNHCQLAVLPNIFLSRPKESQLAAWASQQSRPVSSRQALMQTFSSMKDKFAKGEIPLPDFWGGYCVVPTKIEFWQGGEHRFMTVLCM